MRFSTIYISMPIMKTSIKSGEKQERSKEAVKHQVLPEIGFR